MGDFVAKDAILFINALTCGVTIAAVYDVIRILRIIIPHFNLIVGIEDFIFWNISGIYMFGVMFSENNGVVRGFFLIGSVIGAYVYRKFITLVIIILKKPVNKVIMTINSKKEKSNGRKDARAKKSYKNQSDNSQKEVK